jgi:tetratricopeptide (TPR) repeat protein
VKKKLDDTEAAIKLGITKELLYAYIRNAPKKHLGHEKKLLTVVKNGKNYFNVTDLEEFDKYLKEPWSNSKEPRPEIPKYIQEYLKSEIGGQCPISGKGYPLENAHIISYNESLNHHHHNLLRIAKEEHTKVDNGVISRELLREIKDNLIERLRRNLKLENSSYGSSFHPPNPHPIFIGRSDKLLELTEAMEFERLIIIEGLGGIGKTQLLLNALDNVRYNNPIFWINIEAIGSIEDLSVILHNAISQYSVGNISESIIGLLCQRQITLVFDSLEKLLIADRDEIESFIQKLLTQTKLTQIIITSQIDLSILDFRKKVIKLERLSSNDSLSLMAELLEDQINIEKGHIDWLLNFCNGHPLSIKLVVSLMKFYKSSQQVIVQLKKSGNLKHPINIKHDKSNDLDICLSTIYNCLTSDQKKILHYLKFFPGGIKVKWAEIQLEISMFIFDIAVLQQFFFIETRKDQLGFERLSISNPIHPFLKEKAMERLQESEQELQYSAIVNIMTEASVVDLHYIETGIEGPPSYGIIRIEDELQNLLEALTISQESVDYFDKLGAEKQKIEYLQVISGITGALGKFCFTSGDFENGILFSKAGIEANLKLSWVEAASIQYLYLGQLQKRQFDNIGFAKTVEDLNDLAERTGNIEAKLHAKWFNGNLALNNNDFANAMVSFEEAANIIQKMIEEENNLNTIEKNDDNALERFVSTNLIGNLSLISCDIARAYEMTGNYLEASKHYEKAIEIQEKIEDEINLMSSYHNYANCLTHIDKLDEGVKYYFKSIEGFKRNRQFEYLANSISDLGDYMECRPEIAESNMLDEDTLSLALCSIGYQLKNYIKRELISSDFDTVIENIPPLLIGKMIRIIRLISFSPHRLVLSNWITNLVEEIDIQKMKVGFFTAILNVGHAVGGVDQWRDLSENRVLMLKAILQGCLILNGGPDLKSKTRVFYWLAKWMQFTRLDSEATAEKLWDQAWNSFDK